MNVGLVVLLIVGLLVSGQLAAQVFRFAPTFCAEGGAVALGQLGWFEPSDAAGLHCASTQISRDRLVIEHGAVDSHRLVQLYPCLSAFVSEGGRVLGPSAVAMHCRTRDKVRLEAFNQQVLRAVESEAGRYYHRIRVEPVHQLRSLPQYSHVEVSVPELAESATQIPVRIAFDKGLASAREVVAWYQLNAEVDVFVLTRSVGRGQRVEQAGLQRKRVALGDVPGVAVSNLTTFVSARFQRDYGAGRVLTTRMLTDGVSVLPGDEIKVSARYGRVTVSAPATAATLGRAGDVVRLRSDGDQNGFRARLLGDGRAILED